MKRRGAAWQLFWAFFRVGIFGFGGGPAMIPLVRAEVVTRHHWLTDEEFAAGPEVWSEYEDPIPAWELADLRHDHPH